MTTEQYNKLNEFRTTLEDIVIHNCTPSNNVIRAIDAIYHEIYPTSAPTNFSCNACITDMVKTAYNTLLKFGN